MRFVFVIIAGTTISTGEEVAIKLECIRTKHPQLHIESKFYKMMQGGGRTMIFKGILGLIAPSVCIRFKVNNSPARYFYCSPRSIHHKHMAAVPVTFANRSIYSNVVFVAYGFVRG